MSSGLSILKLNGLVVLSKPPASTALLGGFLIS